MAWPFVSSLIVSPDEPPKLYAVVAGQVLWSSDRGASWQPVDLIGVPDTPSPQAIAMDYRHPEVFYLTTAKGIYRREGAGPWTLVNTLFAYTLAVDLVDSNTLWAGVRYTTERHAVLLKSEDRGRTWGRADQGLPVSRSSHVGSVAIDPQDPNIMYAVVRISGRFGWPRGQVYRGGRAGTWEPLPFGAATEAEGGCHANGLAFDPNLRRLYAGCDAYYYNESRLLLLSSDNAHSADSGEVVWSPAATFAGEADDFVLGSVRPLAVDARDLKSVFVAISRSGQGSAGPENQIVVSHDDGASWETVTSEGLP